MDQNQNNQFQHKIEPINEEAVLQELATTQPAPSPQTPPETSQPVTQTPDIASQSAQPSGMGELVNTGPAKTNWVRLIVTGAVIAFLLKLILTVVLTIVSYVMIKDPTTTNIGVTLFQIMPYVVGLLVIYISVKLVRKLNPVRPILFGTATFFAGVGVSQLLTLPLDYSTASGKLIASLTGSSIIPYFLVYIIGGAVGIIAVTYLMKLLQPRITKNNFFIVIVLLVSLVPTSISTAV